MTWFTIVKGGYDPPEPPGPSLRQHIPMSFIEKEAQSYLDSELHREWKKIGYPTRSSITLYEVWKHILVAWPKSPTHVRNSQGKFSIRLSFNKFVRKSIENLKNMIENSDMWILYQKNTRGESYGNDIRAFRNWRIKRKGEEE